MFSWNPYHAARLGKATDAGGNGRKSVGRFEVFSWNPYEVATIGCLDRVEVSVGVKLIKKAVRASLHLHRF